MSECLKALAAALPKIANPDKSGKSHHGKYLTLPALLDHVKPILAEHGLAVMQTIDSEGVSTLFVHESGSVYLAGTVPVGAFPNPQAQGSAISYARRYGLQAAVGVSGADDDGNAAQKATQAPLTRTRTGPRLISASQLKALQASYSAMRRDDRLAEWASIIGREVTTANELTAEEATQIMDSKKGDDGNR
jgi:hypothetical protein